MGRNPEGPSVRCVGMRAPGHQVKRGFQEVVAINLDASCSGLEQRTDNRFRDTDRVGAGWEAGQEPLL